MEILSKIRGAFDDFLAPRVDLLSNRLMEGTDISDSFYLDRQTLDSIPLAPPSSVLQSKLANNVGEAELAVSEAFSLFSISEDSRYMDLIYHLKYKGFYKLGIELGVLLAKKIDKHYDALVPVPLHHAKLRERGYNQSCAIARGISSVTNIPIDEKLVRRKNYTVSQTLLPARERMRNVRHVFEEYDNRKIEGSYLVVDDMLTTGFTVNSVAVLLLNKGARLIDVATVATS